MTRAIVPAYLATALVLGGASAAGLAANFLLQIGGLALVIWSLWHEPGPLMRGARNAPVVISALIFGLALVQLVPLPPEIWSELPGRGDVVAELEAIGVNLGWVGVSLDPAATIRSFMWLIPAFGVLLAMLVRGAYRASSIAVVIVGVAVGSVLLGAVQIAGGIDSPAYLYETTNRGIAVGFFANGNHQATLLLTSFPFIAALYRRFSKKSGRATNATITIISLTALGLVTIGLATNGSLAGLGLAIPVVFASLMIAGWRKLPRSRATAGVLAILTAASAIIVLTGPFGNNLFGADARNSADSRLTVLQQTSVAVVDHLPFGTGLGTFVPEYKRLEDPSTVDRFYMNNAHNDYLQLALETGLPGVLLVLASLAWIAVRSFALWRGSDADVFAQAASIAAVTIAVHSLVDYPLRTAGISCVFAACVALMSQPRHAKASRRSAGNSEGVHLTA